MHRFAPKYVHNSTAKTKIILIFDFIARMGFAGLETNDGKDTLQKLQGRRMYDNRLHIGHTETHRAAAQMNGAPTVANQGFQVHVRLLKANNKMVITYTSEFSQSLCFLEQ
uniref:Uncharacterized protein n=1 Tax=Ixodes ricinus TaxID=34613 RepID=A0A0K8RCK3_IXORI